MSGSQHTCEWGFVHGYALQGSRRQRKSYCTHTPHVCMIIILLSLANLSMCTGPAHVRIILLTNHNPSLQPPPPPYHPHHHRPPPRDCPRLHDLSATTTTDVARMRHIKRAQKGYVCAHTHTVCAYVCVSVAVWLVSGTRCANPPEFTQTHTAAANALASPQRELLRLPSRPAI